jgi:hypothetical protein
MNCKCIEAILCSIYLPRGHSTIAIKIATGTKSIKR